MPPRPLPAVFDGLPDPHRRTWNKLHRLTDILVITTCAVIGGAELWEAIAESGQTNRGVLPPLSPTRHGICRVACPRVERLRPRSRRRG